ncbi:MAG: hypothetical protein JSV99_00885 [Planctomycetota bacterium]|nr:MAG: hypothetical protein JSV99_00885 [Planctomycetota bacterium]
MTGRHKGCLPRESLPNEKEQTTGRVDGAGAEDKRAYHIWNNSGRDKIEETYVPAAFEKQFVNDTEGRKEQICRARDVVQRN